MRAKFSETLLVGDVGGKTKSFKKIRLKNVLKECFQVF